MASGKDLNISEITNLDKQIETLMECHPLSENEVKALCERVSIDPLFPYNTSYQLLITYFTGKGDFDSRFECVKCESASHHLRRYSRSVP